MKILVACLLTLILAIPGFAQKRDPFDGQIPGQETWFGTFSIIAFDPETNQLGVGVQSRAFSAGAIVPWVESGVGAVATQAAANRPTVRKRWLLETGFSSGRGDQADYR